MVRAKAQSDIVGAILILIMSMGLVATAYMWGLPLIEKRQGAALIERVDYAFKNTIPESIEFAANNGEERAFDIKTDGLWMLYPNDSTSSENNSIQFYFRGKTTKVAENRGWVPDNCGAAIGILGVDNPWMICSRSDAVSNGYNITYKILFRELEVSAGKSHKIVLTKDPNGFLVSDKKTIRISRGEIKQENINGKTLITTEIKILLE
jgi:hypothetical protein